MAEFSPRLFALSIPRRGSGSSASSQDLAYPVLPARPATAQAASRAIATKKRRRRWPPALEHRAVAITPGLSSRPTFTPSGRWRNTPRISGAIWRPRGTRPNTSPLFSFALTAVLDGCRFVHMADVQASAVVELLAGLRRDQDKSVKTLE